METYTLGPIEDYELIDSGNGEKLEKFGNYIISRPDPNAIWNKKIGAAEWQKANAIFHSSPSPKINLGNHWENRDIKDPWIFSFEKISMQLKLTPFKHTGVFPEQILNWEWFGEIIKKSESKPNILNLFGYTGGATLYAASKGAKVTHVDSSKPSVAWAIENQKLSGLTNSPIRWIVDDAKKFVDREIKRGHKYDAVIMDPPAFGRDQKGKVFKFENDVPKLIESVKKILNPKPLFAIFNSYSTGYSAEVIKNLFSEMFSENKIEYGELSIKEKNTQRRLPAGIFARYKQ